jgi:xanthine/uracil permease
VELIYLKSLVTGIVVLVLGVGLFTWALATFYYDARYYMGHYWFVSLPIMAFLFLTGFYWQLRRTSNPRGVRR